MIDVGRAEETLGKVETAIKRSPTDPFLYIWCFWAGQAALHLGDDETGRPMAHLRASGQSCLAQSYALAGRCLCRARPPAGGASPDARVLGNQPTFYGHCLEALPSLRQWRAGQPASPNRGEIAPARRTRGPRQNGLNAPCAIARRRNCGAGKAAADRSKEGRPAQAAVIDGLAASLLHD